MLSENFSVDEFEYSETAIAKKIPNPRAYTAAEA